MNTPRKLIPDIQAYIEEFPEVFEYLITMLTGDRAGDRIEEASLKE